MATANPILKDGYSYMARGRTRNQRKWAYKGPNMIGDTAVKNAGISDPGTGWGRAKGKRAALKAVKQKIAGGNATDAQRAKAHALRIDLGYGGRKDQNTGPYKRPERGKGTPEFTSGPNAGKPIPGGSKGPWKPGGGHIAGNPPFSGSGTAGAINRQGDGGPGQGFSQAQWKSERKPITEGQDRGPIHANAQPMGNWSPQKAAIENRMRGSVADLGKKKRKRVGFGG